MANQIYFIDSKLDNYQTIIDSLASTDIYYLIDSSSDGLTQMSNVLLNYTNLDSIHVYSHGDVGSLNIGNSIYDNTNITNYKVELENIGKSLSTTGDILLYGCNVGQDEIGLNFINQIAQYTQADVAASDDLTGSKLLGGNWDLEVVSGVVETQTIEVKDYQGVMLDDHSNTTTDATALILETITNGNIEVEGDIDYFKIDLEAGQKYVFDMRKGTLSQLQLDLYNGTSNIALKTSAEPLNSAAQFIYIAESTGTYYLRASEYGNNGNGTYTLKAFVDDNKGTKVGATALTLGTAKEGNIVINGDQDYYKVNLEAGQKYVFDMRKGTLSQLQLDLYNGTSNIALKTSAEPLNSAAQFIYIAESTGTYYLRASEYGNNGNGTYTLKAFVDDNKGTKVGATALTLGTAKEGNIVINGDQDYYKVNLEAGQKYVFDMRKGTLSQLQLDLYNGTSNIALKTSAEPLNSAAQFIYIAESTGTYYLRASEYGNNGNGTYTLKAFVDDNKGTKVGATALTLGTAKEGNIVINGDQDYYKVNLEAGQKYVFDMRKGTLSQLQLDLYNGTSNIALKTSAEPLNSAAQFIYIAESTGTYYLRASEYGNNGNGTYTLKAFVDDNKGTKVGATALTLGTAKEGNIVINGDQDYYKVNLEAGQKYVFDMRKGTLSQLQLDLYNGTSNIALKTSAEPLNSAAQFIYIAESTGTYYLRASEYGNNGKGTYTIKAYKDLVNISKSGSYTLLPFEDNLTLTGTTAINGTGNALNNTIIGNSAANTLNGLAGNDTLNGGAGADVMVGGAGNDIYYVDNSLDKVYETTTTATTIDAGGIDTVNSYITSYSLTSYVENLNLTGTAINGTGNALNNTIIGNSVANTLNGVAGNDVLNGAAGNDTLYGGLGNDTLYGGLGLDKFVFNTDINSTTNKDIIKDFSVVDDTIVLENAIFTKLGTIGTLNTAFFKANLDGLAKDSNDYLVYETDTGKLFYDADGSGTGASIQIALIENKVALTYADFTVI